MSQRVTKDELVRLVSEQTGKDIESVNEIVDTAFEEIYAALKRGECVSLKNLHFLHATWATKLGLQIQSIPTFARAVRLVIRIQRGSVDEHEPTY